MRAVLRRLLLSCSILLAAWGGGYGTAPVAVTPPPGIPPATEPLIRFAATLAGGTLTVAPVAGATSIGTRDIATAPACPSPGTRPLVAS